MINIEIPPGSEDALKRLTYNFTKVVRARIIGTFQYRYVGPIKETPVHGDPHVQKIVTMQMGYGWEGLWDKQITRISVFVSPLASASNQVLERTAARRAFTFQMIKTVLLKATLASGDGRSVCSR